MVPCRRGFVSTVCGWLVGLWALCIRVVLLLSCLAESNQRRALLQHFRDVAVESIQFAALRLVHRCMQNRALNVLLCLFAAIISVRRPSKRPSADYPVAVCSDSPSSNASPPKSLDRNMDIVIPSTHRPWFVMDPYSAHVNLCEDAKAFLASRSILLVRVDLGSALLLGLGHLSQAANNDDGCAGIAVSIPQRIVVSGSTPIAWMCNVGACRVYEAQTQVGVDAFIVHSTSQREVLDIVERLRFRRQIRLQVPQLIIALHEWQSLPTSLTQPEVTDLVKALNLRAKHLPNRAGGTTVVMQSDDATELHVVVTRDGRNAAVEELVFTWLRRLHARAATTVGGMIASSLNAAVDELHGADLTLTYHSREGFKVSGSTGIDVATLPLDPVTFLGWAMAVEPVSDAADAEGDADSITLAYVFSFDMRGIDDDASKADIQRQLQWGVGLKLVKANVKSVAETVHVAVDGPNRQRLRADTGLFNENIGDQSMPLNVRFLPGGRVRLQFYPGLVE